MYCKRQHTKDRRLWSRMACRFGFYEPWWLVDIGELPSLIPNYKLHPQHRLVTVCHCRGQGSLARSPIAWSRQAPTSAAPWSVKPGLLSSILCACSQCSHLCPPARGFPGLDAASVRWVLQSAHPTVLRFAVGLLLACCSPLGLMHISQTCPGQVSGI